MTRPLPPEVAEGFVRWRYEHDGVRRDVRVPVYDNASHLVEPSVEPPLLVAGGYGERRGVLSQAVSRLAEHGIRAVAFDTPYSELPAERVAIEAAAREVPQVVASVYRRDQERPLQAAGRSKGGGELALSWEEGDSIGDTVLLAPVGFEGEPGDLTSEARRRRQFVGRFLLNAVMQLRHPWDPANYQAGWEIARQATEDVKTGRFEPKLAVALGAEGLTEAALRHSRQHLVGIFVGKHDVVFSKRRIRANLDAVQPGAGSLVQELPGSHPSSNSNAGHQQLMMAVAFLRNTQSGTPSAEAERRRGAST